MPATRGKKKKKYAFALDVTFYRPSFASWLIKKLILWFFAYLMRSPLNATVIYGAYAP